MRNLHARRLGRAAAIALSSTTASMMMGHGLVHAQAGVATLEEIVVTAQRRTESLQDVPVAVSAMTSDDLLKTGVQRFSDLERLTPSLTVTDGPGGRFLNIRGIGISVSTPIQSAGVPLHLDGTYIPRSEQFMREAYFDLESVEIYRGPQGTFAGQNSTGGAIFVTSKQPQFEEVDFGVQQTIGTYNAFETEAFINMPISETWAARLAATSNTRDSFFDNHGPGASSAAPYGPGNSPSYDESYDAGNENQQSLRAILRYKPSDALDVRLRYSYSLEETNGSANVRSFAGIFNDPNQIPNIWDRYTDFPSWLDQQTHRGILNVEWQMLDSVLLKSNTGYQNLRQDAGADSDNTSPFVDWDPRVPGTQLYSPQAWGITRTEDKYYFQEFDLVSTGDSPLRWVVGVVGLTQKQKFFNTAGNYFTAATTVRGVTYPAYDPNPSVTTSGNWLLYHQKHESAAAFAEITYDVSDQLQFILGGRYTYDKLELERGSEVRNANDGTLSTSCGGPCNVFGVGEFEEPTGRVALNWFPGGTKDKTLYASYNVGFKPGGYLSQFTLGQQAPAGSDGHAPYKEETLDNFEVGFKINTGVLQTNVAAYYMDYRNYQAQFRIAGQAVPRAQNIPKTEVFGGELETRAVFGNLGLNLNVGYVHSEIQETSMRAIIPANTYAAGCPSTVAIATNTACPSWVPVDSIEGADRLDPSGLPLNYAPQWTYNLSLDYTFRIGADATLTPWIQYSYVDEQWTQLTHASQDYIPERELIDFRLAYQQGEHWRIEGYVTNVLDELYVAGLAGGATANPYEGSIALGAPRQYGVRIQYDY